MEILKYCKMQIAFLLLYFFISYLFVKDGKKLKEKTGKDSCNHFYDVLFLLGELGITLDGITAYTVNHLQQIPQLMNNILHLLYLICYQLFIFVHFMYWLSITNSIPKTFGKKAVYYLPITASVIISIITIPQIYYEVGEYTNYSMGIPVYSCFITIGIYILMTMVVFFLKRNYIKKSRRTAFIAALTAVLAITIIQMIYAQVLLASLAVLAVVISIYLCLENPSVKYLEIYQNEMVTGFATLVESKDGSTGGHIKRSSAYAVLIADQLRRNPKYCKWINKDYIDHLKQAAPMHDVGKIGVPDDILQKPGKLTEEEFSIMKRHPVIGAKIIEETFGHLDDEDYEHMAYKVALYHHEKWNGTGYPKGLKKTEIPLCARIMAVADVFDAVSAKRCYRDAMPLETCYQIIRDGRNKDFDPDVVDAFFERQADVEKIYHAV